MKIYLLPVIAIFSTNLFANIEVSQGTDGESYLSAYHKHLTASQENELADNGYLVDESKGRAQAEKDYFWSSSEAFTPSVIEIQVMGESESNCMKIVNEVMNKYLGDTNYRHIGELEYACAPFDRYQSCFSQTVQQVSFQGDYQNTEAIRQQNLQSCDEISDELKGIARYSRFKVERVGKYPVEKSTYMQKQQEQPLR